MSREGGWQLSIKFKNQQLIEKFSILVNERDKKTNQIKLIKLAKLETQNKLTNVVIPPYKEIRD